MKRWEVIKSLCPNAKVGVEVGVFCGENALNLLKTMPDLFLYLVDPYEAYDHPGMDTEALEWAEQTMKMNLKPFKSRYAHISLKSAEAAVLIQDEIDFVFIDDDHKTSAVIKSVDAWHLKTKCLIGHDLSWPSVQTGLGYRAVKLLDDDCWALI